MRGPTVLISKNTDAAFASSAARYVCHRCSTTSYRALMARGADGAMRASGRHACTGCRLEFDHLSQWIGTNTDPASHSDSDISHPRGTVSLA